MKPPEPGLVSIVIPAYNERGTLEEIVSRVEKVPLKKEIVLAEDGSTDGTREIVARLGKEGRVVALLAERNGGKGMAFRRGLAVARGEVVIIQDADLEYDPAEIPRVVAPILEGRADVCYGSRILGGGERRSSFSFYWGGRLVSLVTTLLYGTLVTDEPTCYKAFRTALLREIPLEGTGFEFEPEVTAKVLRRGLRYAERPISYAPRTHDEGKKINWKDGVRAIWALLIWRVRPF